MKRERAGIGRRIGARRPADRRLVDIDYLVEMFQSHDLIVGQRFLTRIPEMLGENAIQRFVDQRRLARTGDTGDAGKHADRNIDIDSS